MDNLGMVAYTEGGFAYVNFKRQSSCGDNCASCSGNCELTSHLVRVENNLGAKKGDLVELALTTTDFLKMSFLLYMVPLIVLIASIVTLEKTIGNSAIAILSGIGITALSFLVINKYVQAKNEKGKLTVKMERLIAAPDEENILKTL